MEAIESTISEINDVIPAPKWSLRHRIAFRFSSLYLVLFCLATQIFGSLFPIPGLDIPRLSSFSLMREITFWTAHHVFHVRGTVTWAQGDSMFGWVLTFCLVVFAALSTLLWSLLDRTRPNYLALQGWFRLFFRFALAGQMFTYGMAKVIPNQMSYPPLTRLLEPYHDFSPQAVLWYSVGVSPAYEIFAGSAELLGGLLLLIPRTAMLGAMICMADMIQVFTLNMTYDVPVKLLSFHLLLLAIYLLAPEALRLADFFFTDRAVRSPAGHRLFRARRRNQIAVAAQILFGLFLLGMNARANWNRWHLSGGAHARSPLYGIWDVEELSIDGYLRLPLLTDYGRWHRAVFDYTDRMTFQRMDDSFANYRASIQPSLAPVSTGTLALTSDVDKNRKASLTFARAGPDRLTLDGIMEGHAMHMLLRRIDHTRFVLVERGFQWIQENTFNH